MIVFTSDALDSVTHLPKKLHTTLHESSLAAGHPSSIIQTRKGRNGEKILKVVGDEAIQDSIHGTMLDLSDIDWSAARQFRRETGDNVVRFDRLFIGGVLTVYFSFSNDSGQAHVIERAIRTNEALALVPTDDGVVSTKADHVLSGRFPRLNSKGHIDWAILSVEKKNMKIEKTKNNEVKVNGFAAFAPGKEKVVE